MRIQELVADLNRGEVISIQHNAGLPEVAKMLHQHSVGAIPVVDDNHNIMGMVSERDITSSIATENKDFFSTRVYDVMNTRFRSCAPDDFANDAYHDLCKHSQQHMPVVKYNKILAMLNIRDFEHMHKAVDRLSLTDGLTGLFNHRHCLHLLDGEFNQFRRFRTPFSVASIVVDEYHNLIESEGYAVVDNLLKEIGNELSACVRSFDKIGRVDEDRFMILLHNTGHKSARRACDRIIRTVETNLSRIPGALSMSIQIGLAIANENDRSGKDIMKRAEQLSTEARATRGFIKLAVENERISLVQDPAEFAERACA